MKGEKSRAGNPRVRAVNEILLYTSNYYWTLILVVNSIPAEDAHHLNSNNVIGSSQKSH
jgi:hypothetical protein